MTEGGDDAVVVRGGSNRDPQMLLEKLQMAVAITGSPVLSVYSGLPSELGLPHLDFEGTCREADFPHKRVMVSSVRRIESAGFVLTPDPSDGQGPYHYHAEFTDNGQLESAEAFIRAFDEPVENPVRG